MPANHLKLLLSAAIAAASLGALPARAQEAYWGGSLGSSSYPDRVNGVAGNGSGVGGKLFGGYQFSPNFALEAGATDLGRASSGGTHVDGRGLYLDAVGIAPLDDKWSLLGRVGAAHLNLRTSAGNDSGSGLKLGLGAQYAISSRVALRAEWERYNLHAFSERPNIDQFTVGLRVGF